jgi:hypothetical protein
MGTQKKCFLFRNHESLTIRRESAIMTSPAAAQPVKRIRGFVRDQLLKVILPRNIRRMR